MSNIYLSPYRSSHKSPYASPYNGDGSSIALLPTAVARFAGDESMLLSPGTTDSASTDTFTFSAGINLGNGGGSKTQVLFRNSNTSGAANIKIALNASDIPVVTVNGATMTCTAAWPADNAFNTLQVVYSNTTDTFKICKNGVELSYTGTPSYGTLAATNGFTVGGDLSTAGWGCRLAMRDAWYSTTYFAPEVLPANGQPPSSAAPLFNFDGTATDWNYGFHAGSLGDFTMHGRGVNYTPEINKIAFRKIAAVGDADAPPTIPRINKWIDTAVYSNWTAIGTPSSGTGGTYPTYPGATGYDAQRLIHAQGMNMKNSASGLTQGWYRVFTTFANEGVAEYYNIPLNFYFDTNYLDTTSTRKINITISHTTSATDSHTYTFSPTSEARGGAFTLPVDPELAAGAAITANDGTLPANQVVSINGTGWVPASGIQYVSITFYDFNSLWTTGTLTTKSHCAYLGMSRGQNHTAVWMNLVDDGGDDIIETEDPTENLTVMEKSVALGFPVCLGLIDEQITAGGNSLTAAELEAIANNGVTNLITHGDFNLTAMLAYDVELSTGGEFPALSTVVTANGNTGRVAWTHDYGNGRGVLIMHDATVGNYGTRLTKANFPTAQAVTWSGQVGTCTSTAIMRELTVEEFKIDLLRNYEGITGRGFDADKAKHYVYPQGGLRAQNKAVYDAILQAVEDVGFKTAFLTYSSGAIGSPKGYGQNTALALGRTAIEDSSGSFELLGNIATNYNAWLGGTFKRTGSIAASMSHNYSTTTPGSGDDTTMPIQDVFAILNYLNDTLVPTGTVKVMSPNDMYSAMLEAAPWIEAPTRIDTADDFHITAPATGFSVAGGATFNLVIKRSSSNAASGSSQVDVTITPALFGADSSFTVYTNPADWYTLEQTFTLTADSVGSNTPFTITLSNPLRVDGGPNAATLGTTYTINGTVTA